MSIDFSGVKAISVPEGAVEKITAAGKIIWQKAAKLTSLQYRQVEYIGFDGNSWIDTGYIPAEHNSGGLKTLLNCRIQNTTEDTNINLQGSYDGSVYCQRMTYKRRANSANDMFTLWGGSGSAARLVIMRDVDVIVQGRHNPSSKYQATRTNVSGDTAEQGNNATDSFGSTNPIYIGSCSGNPGGENLIGYVREWVVTNDGSTITYTDHAVPESEWAMHLVPCYCIQSGEIGMFDTVNNVFYGNAGTGTFTKGADVEGSVFEIAV